MEDLSKILDETSELISQKDFLSAARLLEKANIGSPNNVEVLKSLGLCYVNLEDYEQGKRVFEKLTVENAQDANSWFYLANCQDKTGDFDLAMQSYSKVISLRQEFWEGYKNLAVLLLKQGLYEEVIKLLERPLKACGDDYLFQYLTATAHMSLGNNTGAIEYLKKAIELEPNHEQLLNNLGTCYMATSEPEKAKACYEESYNINPQNHMTNYNLGTLNQLRNDYKTALKFFNAAYRLNPTAVNLATMAFCAFQANEYESAVNYYKNLVALHPEKTIFQKNLMNCLIKLGEIPEALRLAQNLSKLNPASVEISKKLAQLYRLNGAPYQAMEVLNALIKRGKIDKELYFEHALCAMKTEDFEKAKNSYRKVLQLDPDDAIAHKDLALLYLNMNLAEWAEDEIQTAYKLAPLDSEVLMGYAVYLYKVQDFEKAETYFKSALNIEPDNSEFLICYGVNLNAQNKLDEAAEVLERALKIDPKNYDGRFYLSRVYFNLKKYAKAKKILEELVREKGDDIEAVNLLGLSYMKLKEWDRAKDIFKELIVKSPQNHIVLVNAGKCALELKEFEEAKEYARQALEIFSDFEDAIKILKKVEANEL